ncbi:hypothetical protein AMTRI_Chr13g92070 [Amborella trichopoda]|uniref:TOD1/MUCI70 glycosyltransferase-like domain-containing protein n=1 Tax=Amborella trichopoda TaxID=13333 RepID=U5D5B1_AMBTC|nr:uncharacterized protein LOC18445969 [Amborella trichopoda]ERN17624.1 hypothetical protein AMTR_s00059p00172350 [Amborella trichopoda]|eukprot:XP_006856157.1 uncharacterized protein LOC18445969 [Amborella trichopoda]
MSSTMNSSIPSFSDDGSDETSRMRARPKRKKKKFEFRTRNHLITRFLHFLSRWWIVLVFLLAIFVLGFEVSRIGKKIGDDPKLKPKLELKPKRNNHGYGREIESTSNLGRLDMPTRIVNGTREPCLKILPLEEVQHMEFPSDTETNSFVKKVVYKSDKNEGIQNTPAQLYKEGSRFNAFTGYQSLLEREKSFKVKETVMVQCGFYSENGGFEISDADKDFMQSCKAVVSTCAFGGGDDLYQPIGMSQASLRKVCYVAFWDEITRATQEAEGRRIGEDNMIGKWRVLVVKNLPFTDQRLNGKIPKMLSHRLFPQARYSIWVDSKSQFRRDPIGVLEALLWRTNYSLAISEHGARSSIYDEGKAVVKKHKATPEEVELQLAQYRRDGFPEFKRFRGKKALAEASVIVREHTPLTNLLMCHWFNEVIRFTSRDQLSFPYVLRRLNALKINMFPVCTRKALVNSVGHRRKVKPLVI